jgi:hypothetical protein
MASFYLLRLVMGWLAPVFHISMTAHLRDRHIGLFDLLIVLVMIVLISAGFVFGYLANALILYICCGWSMRQVEDVFLHSNIPPHWYKDQRNH